MWRVFQLESHEDGSREEDELITKTPLARSSSLLFKRFSWLEHCKSPAWRSFWSIFLVGGLKYATHQHIQQSAVNDYNRANEKLYLESDARSPAWIIADYWLCAIQCLLSWFNEAFLSGHGVVWEGPGAHRRDGNPWAKLSGNMVKKSTDRTLDLLLESKMMGQPDYKSVYLKDVTVAYDTPACAGSTGQRIRTIIVPPPVARNWEQSALLCNLLIPVQAGVSAPEARTHPGDPVLPAQYARGREVYRMVESVHAMCRNHIKLTYHYSIWLVGWAAPECWDMSGALTGLIILEWSRQVGRWVGKAFMRRVWKTDTRCLRWLQAPWNVKHLCCSSGCLFFAKQMAVLKQIPGGLSFTRMGVNTKPVPSISHSSEFKAIPQSTWR